MTMILSDSDRRRDLMDRMPSRARIQAFIDRRKLALGAAPDPWLDDSEDWFISEDRLSEEIPPQNAPEPTR